MVVKVQVPAEQLVALLEALKNQFPDVVLQGVYPN